MEKLFYYHVVFSYSNKKGTVPLTFDNPINTFEDVEDLRNHLEKELGVSNVVIENWIELKGKE